MPNLDSHIGHIFEDIARDYVRELMNRNELHGVDVGAWWSTDGRHEIDIVGVAANRKPTFAGSVKWRDAELGKAILANLDEGIAAMKADPSLPRLLVGRRGASAAIRRIGVRSISLADLYAQLG